MTFDIREKLKPYDLRIYHAERRGMRDDPDDYTPIDFTIEDRDDNVAWVWGSDPKNDVAIECDHPEECVEWGDDDEQGICKLCGATCTWHWEKDVFDNGYDSNGYYDAKEIDVRIPDRWTTPDKIGGLIGEYLDQMEKEIDG